MGPTCHHLPLHCAFKPAFMARRNRGAFNPRVKARIQRLVAAYLSPCPPSSISPPRPHLSRPQAAGIDHRSPLFRPRRRPIPARTSNPTLSTLPCHICLDLVHLRDVFRLLSCSRAATTRTGRSSPPRPSLRRGIHGASLLLHPRPWQHRFPHALAHTQVPHAPSFPFSVVFRRVAPPPPHHCQRGPPPSLI